MAKRTFISFDYEHDEDLKIMLVGQAGNKDTPFSISDWSLKEPLTGDWKAKVRERMKKVEVVAVMCGEHTDAASGVDAEVSIAQEEKIPYFLLNGRAEKVCKKPKTAKADDKIYTWSWDNLKILIGGGR
ncbi:MAG TPA: TIR domain-containing protein [bacterium]|jgi:hypothetical protein|nr:TIR domain-containing protein [bacterium]